MHVSATTIPNLLGTLLWFSKFFLLKNLLILGCKLYTNISTPYTHIIRLLEQLPSHQVLIDAPWLTFVGGECLTFPELGDKISPPNVHLLSRRWMFLSL